MLYISTDTLACADTNIQVCVHWGLPCPYFSLCSNFLWFCLYCGHFWFTEANFMEICPPNLGNLMARWFKINDNECALTSVQFLSLYNITYKSTKTNVQTFVLQHIMKPCNMIFLTAHYRFVNSRATCALWYFNPISSAFSDQFWIQLYAKIQSKRDAAKQQTRVSIPRQKQVETAFPV